MKIEIKKATIKSSIYLAYNYTQTEDNFENQISTKSDAPIHDDLRRAFMSLTPFLAYICEGIDKNKLEKITSAMKLEWSLTEGNLNYDEDLHEFFKKYQTEGFEISGSGEKEGVKIIGSKLLNTMKTISLITPKQNYYDDDFDYGNDLAEVVETCRMEVYEYFKGKQAPNQQTEMDFEFSDVKEDENGTTVITINQ